MEHGPNVTRLITKFIAREAIPVGGGVADGLKFFMDEHYRKQVLEKAEANALMAIELIKIAPDNTWGTDDEEIANILLGQIDERLQQQRGLK